MVTDSPTGLNGLLPVDPADGMAALTALLHTDTAAMAVAPKDLEHHGAAFPDSRDIPFFCALRPAGGVAPVDLWEGIGSVTRETSARAASTVQCRVTERVTTLLGLEPGRLPADAPLGSIGVDSLLAVRLRDMLGQDFELNVPMSVILNGASTTDLGRHVIEALGLDCGPVQPRQQLEPVRPRGRRRVGRGAAASGALAPEVAPAVLHSQRGFHLDACAVERYRPAAFNGRVVLYRATHPTPDTTAYPLFGRTNGALGWEPHCAPDVVQVDGHHFSLMDPPAVHVIAGHLGDLLKGGSP